LCTRIFNTDKLQWHVIGSVYTVTLFSAIQYCMWGIGTHNLLYLIPQCVTKWLLPMKITKNKNSAYILWTRHSSTFTEGQALRHGTAMV